jgi:hypothetical protein
MDDFIGADARQSGLFDRRLDHVLIRLVQIERAAGLEIGLLSEPHHDKARLLASLFGHRQLLPFTGLCP